MPLEMRWVGESDYPRLATVRVQCYAPMMSHVEKFAKGIEYDTRGEPGDYLIASRDGIDVGTSTSLSFNMWIRGGRVPCQGVAYVGTVKTHRRAAKKGGGAVSGERGIASQLMVETLRKAQERGQAVTALMPFRASYYEHFGYGLAEKRTEWTLPLAVLPAGDFDGFHFVQPRDHQAIAALRQREVERGQCNIERPTKGWETYRAYRNANGTEGLEVVDRPDNNGPAMSWMYFVEVKEGGRTFVKTLDMAWDSIDALRRQLHFLASLKDQYSAAIITLPGDIELNRLLKENQIPHRLVEHATAAAKPYTRMQIRVLDHRRVLEAMQLPADASGKVVVNVQECEATISKFRMDLSDGRIAFAATSAPADLECSDVMWASLISGDISASAATRLKLINPLNAQTLRLLDQFAAGPVPFSTEYF